MTLFARLRHRSLGELAWRARALARVHADRMRIAVRRPRWRRETLARILAPSLAATLAHPVRRRDWPAVHAALAAHLRSRPSQFVLDPASRPELRAGILARWPGAADDAARLGDRLIEGRYDLLAFEGLAFAPSGAMPDWHLDPVHGRRAPMHFWADVPYLDPACGDHKIIWELNRHQHWLPLGRASWLTGDPRYGRAILGQLRHWLDANPPLLGINWASMLEIGFRSLSWVWAVHVLLGADPADEDDPWLVDLLVALDRQLTQIERNLSWYFSPNTHLTGEALALYVAGCALPELAASRRWAATGRAVLLAEIARQIAPDGGHVERSTHYHRYTLDFYLLALLVARRTGDTAAATAFAEAVGRLADVMRAFADDEGRIPRIGDDDGGMLCPWRGPQPADVRASVALAALLLQRPDLSPWAPSEDACWMAWPAMAGGQGSPPADDGAAPSGPGLRTRLLPDTGYVVVRDEAGGHLVFDVGPHGFLNGGHAHADALALTLTIGRRPLLVDPGTATYTMDPAVRDRMRRSSSHNTVTLDRRSTSEPAGPFHWRTRADARLDVVRDNPGFVWVDGVCEAGLHGARHRRSVIATPDGWLVADRIEGTGRHHADVHWHLAPAWRVTCAGERALLAEQDGARAWIVHDAGTMTIVRGQGDSDIGWYSPGYGRIEPTCSARTSLEGELPLGLVTWVSGAPANGPTPMVTRLTWDGDEMAPCVAIRVMAGDVESRLLLRTGDLAARPTRTCSAGAYRTDGRLLYVGIHGGRVRTLALADATAAVTLEAGGLSVRAGERVTDLCLRFGGGTLDVLASTPPAHLELRGAALADVTQVRVNGRVASTRRDRDDRLLVASAEARPPAEEAAIRAGARERDTDRMVESNA